MSLKIEIYGNDEQFVPKGEPLQVGENIILPNIYTDEKKDVYVLKCLSHDESSISVIRVIEQGQEVTPEMIENAQFLYNLNRQNGGVEMFLRTYSGQTGKRHRFTHI